MIIQQTKTRVFLRELAQDFRWVQFFAIACLMVLSTLFIYSATYQGGDAIPMRVKNQCLWFAVSIAGYLLFSLLDYHWLCRRSVVFYLAVLVLLVWVLHYSDKIYGARRWIEFQGFKIQPSEFAKLTILLLLCDYLDRCRGLLNQWWRIALAGALTVAPVILIHKQPDLGTALIIVALFFVLMFLAGTPVRFFAIIALVGIPITTALGYEVQRFSEFREAHAEGIIPAGEKFKSRLHLKEYQLNRILGVVSPDKLDRLVEGWNGTQARIAIGSGGWNGKGWTHGNVTRGGYLPRTVSLNDFIFAVFAEETGFVGGAMLVILYATLLLGGVKIALQAGDNLGMLLASGVTFLLFIHVFVNMGMTLGILPIVGVPLPLMSYGGSFVLVCMTALGLLQSVWLHRKPY